MEGSPVKRTFDKLIAFSDCHFGLKYNSNQHNQDCLEFIDWLIALAKREGADTCIFLGDFHHHRSTINVSTLNYSMQALQKLNSAFKKTYMLIGNHDLFYKEKREVHSMVISENFENIQLIEEPLFHDDVVFMPWMIEEEWKDIKKIKTKYMFGHFEIPGFKMNAVIEMPDTGTIKSAHFKDLDYVFTGHFHKRQQRGNIHYIGNPFGHSFADAWDTQRGCMLLEWGKTPEYIDWKDGPMYIKTPLSKLLFNIEEFLTDRTYAHIIIDINISHEDGAFIRDLLMDTFRVREFKLLHDDSTDFDQEFEGEITHQSIDEIVLEQLLELESTTCDPNRLIEIYSNL